MNPVVEALMMMEGVELGWGYKWSPKCKFLYEVVDGRITRERKGPMGPTGSTGDAGCTGDTGDTGCTEDPVCEDTVASSDQAASTPTGSSLISPWTQDVLCAQVTLTSDDPEIYDNIVKLSKIVVRKDPTVNVFIPEPRKTKTSRRNPKYTEDDEEFFSEQSLELRDLAEKKLREIMALGVRMDETDVEKFLERLCFDQRPSDFTIVEHKTEYKGLVFDFACLPSTPLYTSFQVADKELGILEPYMEE